MVVKDIIENNKDFSSEEHEIQNDIAADLIAVLEQIDIDDFESDGIIVEFTDESDEPDDDGENDENEEEMQNANNEDVSNLEHLTSSILQAAFEENEVQGEPCDIETRDDSLPIITVEMSASMSTASPPAESLRKWRSKVVVKDSVGGSTKFANVGKKRARRLENARQLTMLANDGDENDDILPDSSTFRFSKIVEDINLAEEILNDTTMEYFFDDVDEGKGKSRPPKAEKSPVASRQKRTAEEAFRRLPSSEQTFFKRRNVPMGMVDYLDVSVLTYFQNYPSGVYVSEPLTSFERMLLHIVAHYYTLQSSSFNSEHDGERLTKVMNEDNFFIPPGESLADYLKRENFQTSCNRRRRRKFRNS